jgi:hypothetical protein
MKKYVLIISQAFPRKHTRFGEPTHFVESIKDGSKIHTVRVNYRYWRKRFDNIEKGLGMLSVRAWTDTPYYSKQVELFKFYKEDGIGLERLVFKRSLMHRFVVEDQAMDIEKEIAANDGLSVPDFKSWFKGFDSITPLGIIHFTSFRYAKN